MNLPVEFDASNRAKKQLVGYGIEPESDTDDAKTRCPECGTPNDPLAPHPDAGDAAPGAPNS